MKTDMDVTMAWKHGHDPWSPQTSHSSSQRILSQDDTNWLEAENLICTRQMETPTTFASERWNASALWTMEKAKRVAHKKQMHDKMHV